VTNGRITTRLYLRDGDISVTEKEPGHWVVIWNPHRTDHPDYPGVTLDSSVEQMPVEGGTDAIVEWAQERFENRDQRDLVEVSLDELASRDEVTAVQAAFDDEGIPAVATANLARRSAGELPWEVYAMMPVVAFLTAFGAAAGPDAWHGLKRLVLTIFRVRRKATGRDGSIVVEVGDRTVVLTDQVSEEGFRQIAHEGLPPGGYYIWDGAEGRWHRSP
jgi:hypothetical protein